MKRANITCIAAKWCFHWPVIKSWTPVSANVTSAVPQMNRRSADDGPQHGTGNVSAPSSWVAVIVCSTCVKSSLRARILTQLLTHVGAACVAVVRTQGSYISHWWFKRVYLDSPSRLCSQENIFTWRILSLKMSPLQHGEKEFHLTFTAKMLISPAPPNTHHLQNVCPPGSVCRCHKLEYLVIVAAVQSVSQTLQV